MVAGGVLYGIDSAGTVGYRMFVNGGTGVWNDFFTFWSLRGHEIWFQCNDL
jgi:hypothetical protein